jgi:hypothetical protein
MSEQLELPIHLPVNITETGITFDESISFDEWNSLGDKLGRMGRSIQFLIGDWINFGQKQFTGSSYGVKYQEALGKTGLAAQTLMDFSSVANKVEISCRHENLSFEHHRAVAKIQDPEEQKRWLKVAEENGLGKRQLRKSITLGRIATDEDMLPPERGTKTYLTNITSLERWFNQEKAQTPITQWDPERIRLLLEDFEPLKEIWQQLEEASN